MEVYQVDFVELEKQLLSSDELAELALRLQKEAANISSSTEKGLAYYSAGRICKMSGKKSSSLVHRRKMGENAIHLFELAVENGHWRSIESLCLMFKDGQSLCPPNSERYAETEKRKKEWRKEIWDFYVDNIAVILERKGFVGYNRSMCLYAGYTRTSYGVANIELAEGRTPFSLKFIGERKEIHLDEMVDAEVVKAVSRRGFFGVGYGVSEVVLDKFLSEHFRNICERWPDRDQIIKKIKQVFDDVVFPYFFEWEQMEILNKIAERRRKLGHGSA